MRIILFTVCFLVNTLLYSQSVLLTIDQEKVYTDKFEKEQAASLKALGVKQTIDNYIDFSLLRQLAISKGAQKNETYQILLMSKINKLKDKFYYPEDELNAELKYYYEKILTQRKVQLIFFEKDKLPEEKTKRDTYLNSIVKKIKDKDLTFEQAVEKYSVIKNYKTPLYFDVFLFERYLVDAVYNAPVNEITRLEHGNNEFLILVSKERKNIGELNIEKILIKDTSEKGKHTADKVYNEFKQTGNTLFLKDKFKEENIEVSQEVTDVEDDNLYNFVVQAKEAQVFPPIKLKEGYVIYKYLGKEDYDNFEQSKDKIFKKITTSEAVNELNVALIKELKQDSFYYENQKALEQFISSIPESFKEFQKMKKPKEVKLVTIGKDLVLTNQLVIDELKTNSNKNYKISKDKVRELINFWIDENILQYYKAHFDEAERIKKYKKEIENQLLVDYGFVLIQNQILKDEQGQKEFYQKESQKITWKERLEGTVYNCLNEELQNQVVEMLKNKKDSKEIENYFKDKTDSNNNPYLFVEQGKFVRQSVNLPENEKIVSGKIYTTKLKSRYFVIDIQNVFKNDKMSFEEFKSNYIRNYIDYKSEEMIKQLRKNAVINENKSEIKVLEKKYHL